MKEGWNIRNFEKCLVKVPKQKSIKSKNYLQFGSFPIISQESIIVSGYSNDETLLYKHNKPVVIFGDHTKNIKYIDFDFIVGADGVHILLTKDDILPKFFYYELCSINIRNLGYARHYKLLKEKNIMYPTSLLDQQRIVSYLDAEFAKIEALKANAEKQLQAAKDLFQAALKELLTPKEGWVEKKLGEVITNLRTGLNPRTHFKLNTPDATYNYITVRELKGFDIVADEKTDKVNAEALNRINKRSNLLKGDVLFSGTGTIGNTALVTTQPETWNIKEGIYALTPNHKVINSKFLIYVISSDFFLNNARKKAEGTGVKSIPMKRFVELAIYIPNMFCQEKCVAKLAALSANVKALQTNYTETITLCNDLKQALLKKVFE